MKLYNWLCKNRNLIILIVLIILICLFVCYRRYYSTEMFQGCNSCDSQCAIPISTPISTPISKSSDIIIN